MDDYLSKPIQDESLLKAISTAQGFGRITHGARGKPEDFAEAFDPTVARLTGVVRQSSSAGPALHYSTIGS